MSCGLANDPCRRQQHSTLRSTQAVLSQRGTEHKGLIEGVSNEVSEMRNEQQNLKECLGSSIERHAVISIPLVEGDFLWSSLLLGKPLQQRTTCFTRAGSGRKVQFLIKVILEVQNESTNARRTLQESMAGFALPMLKCLRPS